MSDDGAHGIVVIALVGSPFSAHYAADRKASPLLFSSMNVAIYGPGVERFSLTERAIEPSDRKAAEITIGASTMGWDGDTLVVRVDERTTPWGKPVRGTIRIHPESAPAAPHTLDTTRAHRWWPVAPLARIEVALDQPALRFRGHGYHDANAGDVALEETFDRWSWSRARLDGCGRAAILYDTVEHDGVERKIAETIDRDGRVEPLVLEECHSLPSTIWRLPRSTRSESPPRLVRSLEDGPFYARALVESEIRGERVIGMHEQISCSRLAASWVRFFTGFRMRRE